MMRLVYRVPDVVGKLLEPPEETSLYAFLLRDDLDWKLIGFFNSKCYLLHHLNQQKRLPSQHSRNQARLE